MRDDDKAKERYIEYLLAKFSDAEIDRANASHEMYTAIKAKKKYQAIIDSL